LRESASRATEAFLETQIGRESIAVIESGGRARLDNFAVVNLEASPETAVSGTVRRVKITGRNGETLDGAVID
jgi:threonylcarbamoyladenosine tRNA methylthiotransferase MtaB